MSLAPSGSDPKKQVLIVEGRDDRECLYQLFNMAGIDNKAHFQVDLADGYENALPRFEAQVKTAGGVAGLIIDADQEAASRRWQSVRDLLARTEESWGPKLDLYPEFPQDGLVPRRARGGRAAQAAAVLAQRRE